MSLDDALDINRFDLFFGGGGQDKQQLLVSQDLQKKQDLLEKAVEQEKVFLLVCGTYQLFGHYFLTNERKRIPGIGIFDMITEASEQRKIGNVLAKWQLAACNLQPATLVGFENHSGNTFIEKIKDQKLKIKTVPLGIIIKGFGNNGRDKTEGAVFKNVFGTYLHGSLLPKNPHFADYLIQTALIVRYQKSIKLKALDDSLEWKAHQEVIKKRL
ncbi:hypothetical protein A2160_06195 [Candidatus Beckwithbacteria bacterium RBG_13_42_9]|uniref:CobB/CobQ-like glutamine amidotransferase domain-containing protein n=1 Tax=Candidatus Beckwithbacteria bacterium RBG_13_42_9 TaxID=1797457 RepID=A0A1F5E5E6_9BACT|nr:MAG: hypothetical protein A2160_06195 [Candidatus Beckwithbacteria bacterium RBG_13_42_9]